MARSFSDALSYVSEGMQKRRMLARQMENDNFDRAAKLADMQSKGFSVNEQVTPGRRFLGMQVTPDRRSLVMNYDPMQSPDYQKQQADLELTKARTEEARRKASGAVSPIEQARINYYNSKAGQAPTLTPGRQMAKDKATKEIFETVEQNKVKRRSLADAKKALPNVPQGIGGRLKVEYAKRFNPNDPMLQDWQKIKIIGTDAQLLNTAKTKGAISDREMALFAQAAANDDILSAPRLKPVLAKIEALINAEEAGMYGAYQKNYGEDPKTWFEADASSDSGSEVPEWAAKDPERYLKAKQAGFDDASIGDWFRRNAS